MSPERRALAAGLVVLAVGGVGRWATGSIYSSAKAVALIGAVHSSALYLCTTVATTSGTTLALMLTLVGFVRRADEDFDRQVYLRIRVIAVLSTICLIGAVLLLLMLTLPVGEFDNLPVQWYPWLYNVIYALMIFLSALLIGTVTMVLATLVRLIAKITPSLPE